MDGSENLVHLDVGYRIKVTEGREGYRRELGWWGYYGSYGGERGVWSDVVSAKRAARSNGIKKGTYEIWEFHIGLLPDSEIPWFPPTKVYPE